MQRILVPVLVVCLLVWQMAAFAAGKEWSPEEKLSKLTKPAVVRVVAIYWATWTVGNVRINSVYGGYGSGAFIHPDGYVATNAHVVEAYAHTEEKRREKMAEGFVKTVVEKYGLTKEQGALLIASGRARMEKINTIFIVVTPSGEQLPYDVKEMGSVTGEKDGKDVAVIKVEGRNFPTVRLGNSDKVRTGERIFVAGYPSSADLGNWGNAQSLLEWSWAQGTVSSDRKATQQGAPLIQVNAEGIKPGSSGGPVMNTDGEVVGLLTFGSLGGPHWAMATRTLQEYMRKAGVANESGLTDKAYSEGLAFFWQGYYSKALAKFEEVRRLYAKHSEIDSLIADCQNNITQGNDRRYWPDYYMYVGAAAGLLLVVAAALMLGRRRRKAPAGNVPQ